METFLIFIGMALATYATRYTMIAALGRDLPQPVRRWLRYVPPAVLAALIVPPALAAEDHLEFSTRTWSVLVGAVVAWRTRSPLWTVLAGLASFWLLRHLGL